MGCLTETRETLPPARPCASWQGPSPLPQRQADPRPAGGPKPPASARPAPPRGRRFSPAGSGAGLRCAWTCRSTGHRLARAGKRGAFRGPARIEGGRSESEPPAPLDWQGPSPLPQRHADTRPAGDPKPPASARPAPGGRWPLLFPDLPIYGAPSRAGGGNAVRFLLPPGLGAGQRCWHGRGHRPSHSATLNLGQPGAQSPRPAPAPPPASARPRRALACRCAGTCRFTGNRLARAGETACVSCSRPEGRSLSPDRKDFLGRQAGGLLFQHPVRWGGPRSRQRPGPREDRRSG